MENEQFRDGNSPITRRHILKLGCSALTVSQWRTCGAQRQVEGTPVEKDGKQEPALPSAAEGRLLARPVQGQKAAPTGLQAVHLERKRDGLLYVPTGYRSDRPAPLALMLHGAGGNARQGLSLLQGLADHAGLILLAPDSRQQTWDVVRGQFGPDVAYIERALEKTFSLCAVAPDRVAVGGFSDGASYALSLGLTNGDLFTHVIAFSPGFLALAKQRGRPRLFISHGTRDEVLPIQSCSRRIVPQVQRAGYDVRYREFGGPHTVPPEIAREAVSWFVE